MDDLKKLIREIPDYPKPGILFYDLTTLLQDPRGFHMLVDRLCDHYSGNKVDAVVGIEAAAASLIGPGDVVLNLVSGVYGRISESCRWSTARPRQAP